MRRSGPLQELPLDRFLAASDFSLSHSTPFKSKCNKRPLSPGGPNLFSPAKRRILDEEGIFSPDRTVKSPITALLGSGSPAKRLDFGLPKDHAAAHAGSDIAGDVTPTRPQPPTGRLLPSSVAGHCLGNTQEIDDYFSPRPTLSCPTLALAEIPRELPPLADPQSIHFPGFYVHQDPYIITAFPMDIETSVLVEASKENIPLRRKARKPVIAPTSSDLMSQLLTPEVRRKDLERVGKAKTAPATPKKVPSSRERLCVGTPTPRKSGMGSTRMASFTPQTGEERRGMRRMEDVVARDGNDNNDDDVLV